MTDSELIALLKNNPEKGIKALTKQFAGLVYAVIHSKLNRCFDEADIENCMADTFSDFYIGLDKYKAENGSIKSWLCTIARNKAVDLLRKRKRELKTESAATTELSNIAENTVEIWFEREILFDEVIEEIKKMGAPDTEIIIRKYYFNQSSKTIAAALDMTVSNVDTRAHRALKRLREIFGGESK